MIQPNQRLNRPATRPPQIQCQQRRDNRRSSRQRRPPVPHRQHLRTIKLLLPHLRRHNLRSMALEELLAVLQSLFCESSGVASSF
jgi:hypothetical protein